MYGKDKDTEMGTLIGVCLRFCKGDQEVDVWVNMDKIQAIAWTTGEVGRRPANPPHGNSPIPSQNAAPKCVAAGGGEDTQVCWWTGSAWVCD
jgi:hypothetical protein